MDVKILLILAIAALLLGLIISGVLPTHSASTPTPSAAPQITSIEFPKEIQADGNEVIGMVAFQDPDGDVLEARFEIVQAVLFEPFHFDPEVQGQKSGEFQFSLVTVIPQEVTLRVVLVDRAGHESSPVQFTFQAVESSGGNVR